MPRPGRRSALFGALLALVVGGGKAAAAPTLPDGFAADVVARGLSIPTAVAFLPDGRMLVAEKDGRVKVVWEERVSTLLDFRSKVNNNQDRGLLGLAVDPQFASNGFLYLYYAVDHTNGDDPPSGTARLTRVTVEGGSIVREVVLIGSESGSGCPTPAADCIPAESSHTGGALELAPDGTLFLSTGDGTTAREADANALRSQDPDSLGGKLLRVSRTGDGLASNPFWTGSSTANRSKVWALGLRNPFRIDLFPGSSGVVYVGDVGWTRFEEVSVARAGDNLGWPCYEGNERPRGYRDMTACRDLYAQGPSAVRAPLHAYGRSVGATVIGGAFTTAFGAAYEDTYFYADYVGDWIRSLRVTAGHGLARGPDGFATGAGGPVAVERGPDGSLYYVALNEGRVYRIRAVAGNRQPIAEATATPGSGLPPLRVSFSSDGSRDPDGDPLTFSWDFGDGTADSAAANPLHEYERPGHFTATLTVEDGRGGSDSDSVAVAVGNRAPTAVITAPSDALRYRRGDLVDFAGAGTDPEDGALPGASMTWRLVLRHCPPNACHSHPSTDRTGSSGTFQVPVDHEEKDSFFELTLTVTDTAGLSGSVTAIIRPALVGTGEADSLIGTRLRDVAFGGPGHDTLHGLRGADDLFGQRGNDLLEGGRDRDTLAGNRGRDRLAGGPGRDLLLGGPGRDLVLAAGEGSDTIECGGGRDRVVADIRDRVASDCELVQRERR